MGRRYVALGGASFIILGMIVCSTAHTMNTFICKLISEAPILKCYQLTFSRWHGVGRCWSWYQRTHSSGCDFRTCTNSKARKICGSFDLHYPSVLPFSPLGSTDRLPFLLEIRRSFLRSLGLYRSRHDCVFLLPTTQSQFIWLD